MGETLTISYKVEDGTLCYQVAVWLKQHYQSTGRTYYDVAQSIGADPVYLKEIGAEIRSLSLTEVEGLMKNFGVEVEVVYPIDLALRLSKEAERLSDLRNRLQKVLDDFNPSLESEKQ